VATQKRLSSGFALSSQEELVLAALRGRERYGLEIIKTIEEASGGKRKLGFGSLYPTLHKLEREGLVKSRWGEDRPEERGGARRRYYQITGLGERALREAGQLRADLATWQPVWGRA
jgi:PadR family transcriptional regulator PadR